MTNNDLPPPFVVYCDISGRRQRVGAAHTLVEAQAMVVAEQRAARHLSGQDDARTFHVYQASWKEVL